MKRWITRFALLAMLVAPAAWADWATLLGSAIGGLLTNSGEPEHKETEVVSQYRKAAEQGDAAAQFNLGLMYAKGQDVMKDEREAVRWYHKAAEQGDARAQVNLGWMYENGQSITKNAAEAVRWFRKAADQGDAVAQNNLGRMYGNGRGVAQDYTKAVSWFRKAADQGNARAQVNLGIAYKHGRGVNKAETEAEHWFLRALRNPTASAEDKQLAEANLAKLSATAAAKVSANLVVGGASLPVPEAAAPDANPVPAPSLADTHPPLFVFRPGSRITLTEGAFTLAGQTKDDSKIAEIRVDGQPIAFDSQGAFSVKRFFGIGETLLSFTATDIHGNTAKETVTVMRQATEAQAVAAGEPVLVPPDHKAKSNPHALALIIGIEDYGNTFKAQHAARDANLFYDYAQRTLGIPAENIKLLTGEKATRAHLLHTVKNWLAPRVTRGKSQVVMFFAGHGLASHDGEKVFLIPHDALPDMLEETAIDRQQLMANIARAEPQSALFFFDTCYSGQSRGGDKTLVAGSRAITIKPRIDLLPPGFMQFSAAGNDQFAHSHPSQPHGLFSYYLMRGLGGEADANHDNRLTAGELHAFVRERVQHLAQGRPQVPELIGDPERVIAVWKK